MRIVLFFTGMTLIFASALLYPTEEKRLQSRLEDLWLIAGELRPRATSRLAAIIAAAATAVLRLIDRTFDERLFSIPSVASAVLTSAYSLLLVIDFPGTPGTSGLFSDTKGIHVLAIYTVILFVALRYRLIRFVLALLVIYTAVQWAFDWWIDRYAGAAVLAGALTDLLILWVIRALLRYAVCKITTRRVIVVLVTHVLILFGVLAPLIYVRSSEGAGPYVVEWVYTIGFVIIASGILIVTLCLMVVHRVLWPLFERALYALASYKVFENRGRLLAMGVALIVASSPTLGAIVAAARKYLAF